MAKTEKELLESIEEKESTYTALIRRYEEEEEEEKALLDLLKEYGY